MSFDEIRAKYRGQPLWVVRAGKAASFAEEFVENGFVAIAWNEVGPLDSEWSAEEIAERFETAYPNASAGARAVWAAQVKRFTREIHPGEPVATYDATRRMYFLGIIESDVEWRDHILARTRRVQWVAKAPRDRLSVATRNSLGCIATLFQLSDEASEDIWEHAVAIGEDVATVAPPGRPTQTEATEEESESILREDVSEKAQQFIEDRIARLTWEQMQELVAGLLRAMGYRTRLAEPGPDRGVDVFASPDGLGLQEPRVFVQVKHRPGTTIGAPDLRSFIGGRRQGDKCLFVSTGGFTKEARYEGERSAVPVTLLALPELRELLVEHYENLDTATRDLVPLTRLYWPVD